LVTGLPSRIIRSSRRSVALGAVLLAASTATVLATANTPVEITNLTLSRTAIAEGETVTLTGEFTDPDLGDGHSVFILWGHESLTRKWQLPVGQRSFQIQHTFADDKDPAGPLYDEIYVTVMDHQLPFGANDNTTDKSRTGKLLPIQITNVAPRFVERGITVTKKGGRVFVEGDIVDPGTADQIKVGATWGDTPLQAPAACSLSNGDRHFICQHAYQPPLRAKTYPIALTVKDDDGGVGTYQTSVQVP
jgi:hypothetical protein